jgi:hypothetical protein
VLLLLALFFQVFFCVTCPIKRGILLSFVFMPGSKMYRFNKNSNNYFTAALLVLTAVVITTVSPFLILSTIATPVAATTIGNTTTTTTPSSEIELSPQPVYQEQIRDIGLSLINQTHIQITFSGNGTLNLPNGTETIRTTSSVSGMGALIDNDIVGKEILTTEDGSESATTTVHGILRFNEQEGTGRGIIMAVFHTNSTGMLAPLDGMILAGIIELYPDGTGLITLSEWQSGIPLPTATTATTPPQEHSPLTDTTTNATTTAPDTNGATPAAPAPEQGEGEEQQQQTTIAPNPLFE